MDRSPESRTSIITPVIRQRGDKGSSHLYWSASHLHLSLCSIFSHLNELLLSYVFFSLFICSVCLGEIQAFLIILPFKNKRECHDSSFLDADLRVRVANKAPSRTCVNKLVGILTPVSLVLEMLASLQPSPLSQCQVWSLSAPSSLPCRHSLGRTHVNMRTLP